MSITSFADQVYDAIKDYLTDNWTATPIQWPNEEFQPTGDEPFVKIEMHGMLYDVESIGAEDPADNRWDEEGTLWMHVTVPRGTSYTNARGAAKALANLFRGQSLLSGNLEFRGATIGASHYGDELGAWYLVPVSLEWRHIDA